MIGDLKGIELINRPCFCLSSPSCYAHIWSLTVCQDAASGLPSVSEYDKEIPVYLLAFQPFSHAGPDLFEPVKSKLLRSNTRKDDVGFAAKRNT